MLTVGLPTLLCRHSLTTSGLCLRLSTSARLRSVQQTPEATKAAAVEKVSKGSKMEHMEGAYEC